MKIHHIHYKPTLLWNFIYLILFLETTQVIRGSAESPALDKSKFESSIDLKKYFVGNLPDEDPSKFVQTEIQEISFESNKLMVHGSLHFPISPDKEKKYPAMLILHHSGRGDRNSTLGKGTANYLASRGIAILRYDSPGTGKSPGDAQLQSFQDRAQEAISAINRLRSHPQIDRNKVGVFGFSQGGWITCLAASMDPNIAFVISVSGPGVSVSQQNEYELINKRAPREDTRKAHLMRTLHDDLKREEPKHLQFAVEESKKLGPGPWDNLIEVLKNRKDYNLEQQYNIVKRGYNKWHKLGGTRLTLRKSLRINKSSPEQFWRAMRASRDTADFDPLSSLKKVQCSVFMIFGEQDPIQPVAKSIENFQHHLTSVPNNDVTFKVFEGAGHNPMKRRSQKGKSSIAFHIIGNWLIERFVK